MTVRSTAGPELGRGPGVEEMRGTLKQELDS